MTILAMKMFEMVDVPHLEFVQPTSEAVLVVVSVMQYCVCSKEMRIWQRFFDGECYNIFDVHLHIQNNISLHEKHVRTHLKKIVTTTIMPK